MGCVSLRNLTFALALAASLSLLAPQVFAQTNGPASVAELVRGLQDAVVNISSSRPVPGRGMPFPDVPEGSPLEEFFNERNPNMGQGPGRMREAESLGSGFFISADGVVVTNNHVIADASEVVVVLTDGTRLVAEVLGQDDRTDLAVLKVEADRDFTFVEFGDSELAEVGDWVMAIGNPFGLGGSVSIGIVSARNRDINSGPYDSFIQTDAAINQGNSGGPLFDMDGKVVGINTAILSRTGGSLGIGFAIPGNLALPIIGQLAEFGETRRGWLGVGIQDVSLDMAESLGRTSANGALVLDVTRGGPGDGIIRNGDIILEFDGRPIARMRDLPLFVAQTEVGKEVEVLLLRGGNERRVTLTLGRLETGEEIIAQNAVEDSGILDTEPEIVAEPDLTDLLGLDIAPLDDGARSEYGISAGLFGVLIDAVRDTSDAADKGVVAGLVIEEVNQQPVAAVADVEAIVGAAREAGRPAVLFKLVDPSGIDRYVAVRFE
jgi:serine protease Do